MEEGGEGSRQNWGEKDRKFEKLSWWFIQSFQDQSIVIFSVHQPGADQFMPFGFIKKRLNESFISFSQKKESGKSLINEPFGLNDCLHSFLIFKYAGFHVTNVHLWMERRPAPRDPVIISKSMTSSLSPLNREEQEMKNFDRLLQQQEAGKGKGAAKEE